MRSIPRSCAGILSRVGPDLELVVKLSGNGSAATTIEASGAGSKPLPPEVRVQKLSDGDIEVSIGEVSLEFHADGGEHAAENAKRYYAGQFQAADKDNNKYLEKTEVKDHGPFASLFDMMDKDGDGKLYMKEVDAFVDQQTQAARSQMVLSVADQGRAIFAIMDLQSRPPSRHSRDPRRGRAGVVVGPKWRRPDPLRRDPSPLPVVDRPGPDHGGRHVARLPPQESMTAPSAQAPPAGPSWFRKMDRNRDGDISRREFLGPRADVRAARPRPRRPDRCRRGGEGEAMSGSWRSCVAVAVDRMRDHAKCVVLTIGLVEFVRRESLEQLSVLRIELDRHHRDRPARSLPEPERAVTELSSRVVPALERTRRHSSRSSMGAVEHDGLKRASDPIHLGKPLARVVVVGFGGSVVRGLAASLLRSSKRPDEHSHQCASPPRNRDTRTFITVSLQKARGSVLFEADV